MPGLLFLHLALPHKKGLHLHTPFLRDLRPLSSRSVFFPTHITMNGVEKDQHGADTGLREYADDHHEKHGTMTATPAEMAVIEDARNAQDVEMDDLERSRLLRRIDIAIVPCELGGCLLNCGSDVCSFIQMRHCCTCSASWIELTSGRPSLPG